MHSSGGAENVHFNRFFNECCIVFDIRRIPNDDGEIMRFIFEAFFVCGTVLYIRLL